VTVGPPCVYPRYNVTLWSGGKVLLIKMSITYSRVSAWLDEGSARGTERLSKEDRRTMLRTPFRENTRMFVDTYREERLEKVPVNWDPVMEWRQLGLPVEVAAVGLAEHARRAAEIVAEEALDRQGTCWGRYYLLLSWLSIPAGGRRQTEEECRKMHEQLHYLARQYLWE
jgi:hypothetical protein